MHHFRFRQSLCVALALSMKLAIGADVAPISVSVNVGDLTLEPGATLKIPFTLSSASLQPVAAKVEFVLQRDASLYSKPEPHPLYGQNIALGAKSWAEGKGQPVVERNEVWGISNGRQTGINALTDGQNWTEFGTVYYNKDQWTEAFGYIDLGRVVRIVHLSADMVRQPDKTGKVDVSASIDRTTYTPVPGLQGIADFAKGFGRVDVVVPEPFEARFVRLRLHHDGTLVPFFRFPANIQLYTGIEANTFEFPKTGEPIEQGTFEVPASAIAAAESVTLPVSDAKPLQAGAYLLSMRVTAGGSVQLLNRHVFVMPAKVSQNESGRFGINVSNPANAEAVARAGAAWARFELRWPIASTSPGEYQFDVKSGPTISSYDDMMRACKAAGIATMPVLVQTPPYLLSESGKTQKDAHVSNPPADLNRYGEFVFQTVARYGSRKHDSAALLTSDKQSGLGLLSAIELWREPNADNTRKTNWKGSLDDYYAMFRIGAEAAKKADPAVQVANGGWSHFELPILETMRTFKYADGKTPIDFTDILSGHYFSYRVAPELATVYDISHHHEGIDYDRTVEQDLLMTVAWRNEHKPAMPIWVTAAGHDSMDVEERLQAAWMPRGILTALAAGVDKVMVHQDQGRGAFQDGATGIIRDKERTFKPAWFTYANLVRQMADVKGPAKRLATDPNVRAYVWTRGDQLLVTAWAVSGSGKLEARFGQCEITDSFGAKQVANVDGDLALTEFPVYLSGFTDPAVIARTNAAADAYAESTRLETERKSALRTYLFKFGQPLTTPTILIGTLRSFTTVAAADAYDDSKGYGFIGKGLKDGRQQYYQHPLTEDFVGAPAETRFTFKASPGTYTMKLCTRPYEAPVEVSGLEGGDIVVKPAPGGHYSETRVTVGAQPITLKTTTAGGLVWLTVVQDDDAANPK